MKSTLWTAGRILQQLRNDPRTIGLLLVVPLSYAVDAMKEVTSNVEPDVTSDVVILLSFIAVSLTLGALTLRRRTA